MRDRFRQRAGPEGARLAARSTSSNGETRGGEPEATVGDRLVSQSRPGPDLLPHGLAFVLFDRLMNILTFDTTAREGLV